MNEQTDNKANEQTVLFELPSKLTVTGARGIKIELDLTKATNTSLLSILDYWFGVVTIRASASIDGFEEKVKTEKDMAARLAKFDWTPGGKGGGARIDDETKAAREILTDLFTAQGEKKANAVKRAKGANAWEDLARMSIARATNRTEISDDEVQAAVAAKQSAIDEMIAARVKAMKAERERKEELKKQANMF